MKRSMIARALALASLVAVLIAPLGFVPTSALAFEQGTIAVSATWAPGGDPVELEQVCFRVTGDEAGVDELGTACSSDESLSVTFGPTAPDLQTGVTYYIWEIVGVGWEVNGANPASVVITDTTGEATVVFENRRIDGAWIEAHEYACPPGFQSDDIADYAEACQANPRADVAMSASGPNDRFTEATTDARGAALFAGYTEIGEVMIAESVPTGDFVGFVVGCTRLDTLAEVPISYRTNGHAAFAFDLTAELADGDIGIRCDWYNIPPAPADETASLTLHTSICPVDVDPNDRFELCHADGVEGVSFTLDGPVQRTGVTEGHLGAILWDELPAGTYTVAETSPLDGVVGYDVYCSRTDNAEAVNVTPRDGDLPSIDVEVGAGAQIVCDWYNLTAVETPTTTPTSPPMAEITLAIAPHRGQGGDRITYAGTGYTPGGAVSVLMTGDGLIVDETVADGDGSIAGTFRAPDRDRLTGESTNRIPVFAIDEATGRESLRVTFTYTATLPTATATSTPTATPTSTPTATPLVGRPVHIHRGVCDALDPDWSAPLTDLTTPIAGANDGGGATIAESSFTVVDIPLAELLGSDYAINAHPSRAQMRPFVACGEIGGPIRADGSVVIGLREQNGSGLTGIAYLQPDPANPNRTLVSVFLAPGLAEEDPTLVPATDGVVLHAIVTNGPVAPEFQAGYEITIRADGSVEIVVTTPGAETPETSTGQLDRAELLALLASLHRLGFFQLTQAAEIDPDDLLVGGGVSALTVTLIDGTWEVNGNGLPEAEQVVLAAAQQAVADAVEFTPDAAS